MKTNIPKNIPEAAWKTAQQCLVDAPKKWVRCGGAGTTDRIASGAYITKEGNLYAEKFAGAACHGFMEYACRGALFFNTMNSKHYESKEVADAVKAFCDWMKNKSPLRNFILN